MEDSGQDLMISSQMLHSDGAAVTMDDPSTGGFRKRAPDESCVSAGDARERIAAVKKRILEHKHLRLKSVKEKHAEHVAEWFYLQSGGNLMDYQVWRKKSQTPELISFMRSHRLESPSADDGNQMNMVSGRRRVFDQSHPSRLMIPVF